ncbi:MAG: 16S rRNA (cytosine(1402)-N(4))-methyltransferase RsmH, partial [bacterium]
MTGTVHVPVLEHEVLQLLNPSPESIVLDGTVGTGGHALALLHAMGSRGQLVGFDLDETALAIARQRLAPFGERVLLLKASYADASDVLGAHPTFQPLSSILLDLGFSTTELVESGRGFSYRHPDEPLDMRFDPSGERPTAASILATRDERELATIIAAYGEEPLAGRIAQRIVRQRKERRLERVHDLVEVILTVYGRRRYAERSRQHPAARTFQALRIAVNDELGTLHAALPRLTRLLAPGGRIAVISFHSIEDRIVKTFFTTESRQC